MYWGHLLSGFLWSRYRYPVLREGVGVFRVQVERDVANTYSKAFECDVCINHKRILNSEALF